MRLKPTQLIAALGGFFIGGRKAQLFYKLVSRCIKQVTLSTKTLRKHRDLGASLTFALHGQLKLKNSKFFAQIYRSAH